MANAIMATERPLFGPTRVSVLRRANRPVRLGGSDPDEGGPKRVQEDEVVEALVHSGAVREGQVLEAVLPAPIVFARRSRRERIQPEPTTVATFSVVSIQRFEKPRYSARVAWSLRASRLRLRLPCCCVLMLVVRVRLPHTRRADQERRQASTSGCD
jgi:hypothetical protein